MMISTKGRYALRIMVDVAQHDGEMPVSVREIAQRQDISGKYMEQIISVLTRSGLLRSIRGAQDHADGDLLGALGQMIAALRAAKAFYQTGLGQWVDNLLQIFLGNTLILGDCL